MNGKLQTTWKEADMTQFKALSQNLSGGTEENI
jgi:hypothetical protein